MKVERRTVLAGGLATAAALSLGGCAEAEIPGTLSGPDFVRGHALRDRRLPLADGPVEEVGIAIAGGGVAGLAAGWRLANAGFHDFALFELENETGGNARAGRNPTSAYPLGAHYLPVPNREARALRAMLREFGMIVGEEAGAPVYDPFQLCADLEERLFWRGGWQEGLYPQSGLSPDDERQRDRFNAAMAGYRHATGYDGKTAFAIPMALSSNDPAFTDLDRRSFATWLDGEAYTSAPLRAYLRYCCRDDYGTEPEQVSAWAGIHYFAARRGWAARGDGDRELTWPEGNGRLVNRMARQIATHIRRSHTVVRALEDQGGVMLHAFDHGGGVARRVRARVAILAMPHFVARRVAPEVTPAGSYSYAPWVVANVTVSRRPKGPGTPLAWDNVSAASESLGYVVATHQTASGGDGASVLTWYMPLSRETPERARHLLLARSLAEWQRLVREDLLAMNPDLAGAIERIDVWRWGHAMIRPTPGFLDDPARRSVQSPRPPLLFAHSDMSGLSLFEEAHYRGVCAAETAMAHLDHVFSRL